MDMTKRIEELRAKLKQLDESLQPLRNAAALTTEQWDEKASKHSSIKDMCPNNVVQLRPRR